MKTKRLELRISEDDLSRWRDRAAENELSLSAWVIRIVNFTSHLKLVLSYPTEEDLEVDYPKGTHHERIQGELPAGPEEIQDDGNGGEQQGRHVRGGFSGSRRKAPAVRSGHRKGQKPKKDKAAQSDGVGPPMVEAVKSACEEAVKSVEAGALLMVPGLAPPISPRVNVKAALEGISKPRKLSPDEMCERCRVIGVASCEKCKKKALEPE